MHGEVLLEQIGLFRRNFLHGGHFILFGQAVFAASLWQSGLRTQVVLWWCVAVAVELLDQLTFRYWFEKLPLNLASVPRYAARLKLGVTMAGIVWAAAACFIAAAHSAGNELWIVAAIMLVSLGACAGCSAYLPALYCWTLPVAASLVVNLIFFSDQPFSGIYLAGGVLIAFAAMLAFSHTFHRTLVTSIVLNLRNRELAAENALKKEEADRANRAKSAFLASASHDLRQPMQAVRLLVSNLSSLPQSDGSRVLLEHMRDSVEAMGSQLDFLLDISRLDAGGVQPRIAEFELAQLFHRLRSHYVPLAQAKGLTLVVEPTQLNVRSDPDLLERMVQNLLSNAVRYTDQGKIEVRSELLGADVRITVSDTGVGIPEAELTTIFEVLKQLSNPERDHRRGTGLGLAIVERLARLLQHPVTVQSRPQQGSVFCIDVPVATAPIAAEPATTPDSSDAVAGAFVVVIEDNPTILEALGRQLADWQCPVVAARTAQAAVKALGEHERSPDLIISDHRLLNEETALNAIQSIRGVARADVPAIVITGDSDPTRLNQITQLGIQVLRKPVSPSALKRAMANALPPTTVQLEHQAEALDRNDQAGSVSDA